MDKRLLRILAVILAFVCLAGTAFFLTAAPGYWVTTVDGSLTTSRGQPDPTGMVYFANRVNGDIFLAPVDKQGAFSVELPVGAYDMRSPQGDVLRPNISVGSLPVKLGPVKEPAFSLWRFLQGESADENVLVATNR